MTTAVSFGSQQRRRQQGAGSRTAALQLLALLLAVTAVAGKPMDREQINPLQLSTFKGYQYDYSLGNNGAYEFYYSLPQSSRREQRTQDGDVRGSYSFVAPEGDEFDFKYEADKKGFRVESNALPELPRDTDEVRRAKEQFFEAYKKALLLVSSSETERSNHAGEEQDDDEEEEDEEEEEEEESEEESDEDSDEDSDEESDEDSDEDSEESDEESSEESSEEDDDDDDDDEDEDEEEEKGRGVRRGYKSLYAKRPISPSKTPFKNYASKKRAGSTFKRPVFVSSLPRKRFTSRAPQQDAGYGARIQRQKQYNSK